MQPTAWERVALWLLRVRAWISSRWRRIVRRSRRPVVGDGVWFKGRSMAVVKAGLVVEFADHLATVAVVRSTLVWRDDLQRWVWPGREGTLPATVVAPPDLTR